MGNLEGFPFLPGFVFRPTEEDLVYYLRNKSSSSSSYPESTTAGLIIFHVIRDVTDVYEYDPHDLPEKFGFHGGDDDDKHCYFFTARRQGYTGFLDTKGGFWKTTGRDQPVVSKGEGMVVALRNTLVYFKGKAPESQETDWIMYEYVLVSEHHGGNEDFTSITKDSFALCHVFLKSNGRSKVMDCDYEDEIADVPVQQHHGTSFSGIVEVDVKEETMVAPYDDHDELHKILMEIIDKPNDVAVDAFEFPTDISMSNQLVNANSGCPEILEGDFMELDDLLSPLTDTE